MLGALTQQLIAQLCPAALQAEICALLSTQCAHNLPGIGISSEWNELIDRIQLAVLKGSGWKVNVIRKRIELAQGDWRELLMHAQFAENICAHKAWQLAALQFNDIS